MNAYHSHYMQILADDYLTAVHEMAPRKPSRAAVMSSSVTSQNITYQNLGPSYWIQNLVSPVQFSTEVESLLKQPVKGRRQNRTTESAFDYIVEIGPHSALKGPLRQILQAHSANQIQYTSLLTRWRECSPNDSCSCVRYICPWHPDQYQRDQHDQQGSFSPDKPAPVPLEPYTQILGRLQNQPRSAAPQVWPT